MSSGDVTQAEYDQQVKNSPYSKTILGFWVYLMTDCILFSILFVTYVVLKNDTFDGPTSQEIFNLDLALQETLILLSSSFTCGLALLAAIKNKRGGIFFWLIISFILGIAFLTLEGHEFIKLYSEGNSWRISAFLSSYFTLVGTHGLHISVGLIWMLVMMIQIKGYGLTSFTFRRFVCLGMFWHFLDIVWIFIFTVVYLMGVS